MCTNSTAVQALPLRPCPGYYQLPLPLVQRQRLVLVLVLLLLHQQQQQQPLVVPLVLHLVDHRLVLYQHQHHRLLMVTDQGRP